MSKRIRRNPGKMPLDNREKAAGFTLGANQAPHISLVHRYVRAGDLPTLEAKLAALLAADNPLIIQLTAIGYEHSQWEGLALMTIARSRLGVR